MENAVTLNNILYKGIKELTTESKNCLWIEGKVNTEDIDILKDFTKDNYDIVIEISFNQSNRSLLYPFKELLRENSKYWLNDSVLTKYSYEINTLFPNQFINSTKEIHEISWGWSEVRLNRDIHWAARLIFFIGIAIEELAKKKKILFIFKNFQYAERITIFCTNYILNSIENKHVKFFITNSEYDFQINSFQLDNGVFTKELINRVKSNINPIIISEPTQITEQLVLSNENSPVKIEKENKSIDNLVRCMQDSLISFDLENVLYVADKLLPQLNKEHPQSNYLSDTWKLVGISQTFMDNFHQSINSFVNMLHSSTTLAQQIKSYHLLALLYGKRLNNWNTAKKLLNEAIEIYHKEVNHSFEDKYELCWVYNYLAYISYLIDKDFNKSMSYVLKAFKIIKPYRNQNSSANIMDETRYPILSKRLIANLTVNTVYLYYYNGNYNKALKRWKNIEAKYLSQAHKSFRKEHFYYEGNIYLSLGDYEQAIESFKESLQTCQEFSDHHYEEIALRNLAYSFFLSGDFQESFNHYTKSLILKNKLAKKVNYKHYQSIIIAALKSRNYSEAENYYSKFISYLDPDFINLYKRNMIQDTSCTQFLEKGPILMVEKFDLMEI